MSQLESDLRARLQALDLPDVPPSLDAELAAVVTAPRPSHRPRLLAVALVAAVAIMLVGLALGRPFGNAPVEAPPGDSQPPIAQSAAQPSMAEPSTSPSSPSAGYAFPSNVDGLHVNTVGELLQARAAKQAAGGPFALKGFWSSSSLALSCPAPQGNPGVLELYCQDGQVGIAQEDEPLVVVKHVGNMTYAEPGTTGPKLTPYLTDAMYRQLDLQPVAGQAYPPVPIVVVGHFDDPRATACRPEARQACEDRLVVDRIVLFALDAVPSPGITAQPTPYQPGPSESPPFESSQCDVGGGKPNNFSYVGWMDGGKLNLTSGLDFSNTTLWVAISKDTVALGEWYQMPGDTRESLPMGRLVCYAFGGIPFGQGMAFDSLAGTSYRLYRDGSTARPTTTP